MAVKRIEERTEDEIAKAVAESFINHRGRAKFLRLIEMLQASVPGPKIAHEFGVKRQRVHQWKTQLGYEETNFHLHPQVQSMLGTITSSRKSV